MPREISQITKKDLAYLKLKNMFLQESDKIEDFDFSEFVNYLETYFR